MSPSAASVSGELLALLLSYVGARGVDVDALLRRHRIDPASAAQREERFHYGHYQAVLRDAAEALDDPDLGLHFGAQARRFPPGHLLMAVMRNSPDVGAALERFFRFHSLMIDALVPRLDHGVDDSDAEIAVEAASGTEVGRLQIDISLALCVVFVTELSKAARVDFSEVCFCYPAPADIQEHERIFGPCPLRFGQPVSRLRFTPELLRRPLEHADDELLAHLEEIAHARLLRASTPATWGDRAHRSILETLLRGARPTVDATARELAVSARQLQLHLKSEETSYTELLDGLRLQLAEGYLRRDDLSLCEVAFLLGYAEQSSFNHAFKRWTGCSPTEYRGSVRH